MYFVSGANLPPVSKPALSSPHLRSLVVSCHDAPAIKLVPILFGSPVIVPVHIGKLKPLEFVVNLTLLCPSVYEVFLMATQ
jgi:hypothetical protein